MQISKNLKFVTEMTLFLQGGGRSPKPSSRRTDRKWKKDVGRFAKGAVIF